MNTPTPEIWSYWRHYTSHGGKDHVYQVRGIGRHSETHEQMVVYVPQYRVPEDSWVYGADFALRPLIIWYDQVDYEGKRVQRFTQLSTSEILQLGLGNP